MATTISGTVSGRISSGIRRRLSPTTRCVVTDVEVATAQLTWTNGLRMPELIATIYDLETEEAKRAGLKKASRRAKPLDVLTFRNAIVKATLRAHERQLDHREFFVRAYLPSHDVDAWAVIFHNDKFDVFRSSQPVLRSGLCQVDCGTDSMQTPKSNAYEDLTWSMRTVPVATGRTSYSTASICRVENVSRDESRPDYKVSVWFDKNLADEEYDHKSDKEAPCLCEVEGKIRALTYRPYEASLTIEINSRYNNPSQFYHSYKLQSSNAADIERAAKLVSYVESYVNNTSPTAVLRLMSELGYATLIESP